MGVQRRHARERLRPPPPRHELPPTRHQPVAVVRLWSVLGAFAGHGPVAVACQRQAGAASERVPAVRVPAHAEPVVHDEDCCTRCSAAVRRERRAESAKALSGLDARHHQCHRSRTGERALRRRLREAEGALDDQVARARLVGLGAAWLGERFGLTLGRGERAGELAERDRHSDQGRVEVVGWCPLAVTGDDDLERLALALELDHQAGARVGVNGPACDSEPAKRERARDKHTIHEWPLCRPPAALHAADNRSIDPWEDGVNAEGELMSASHVSASRLT